jgi:hypothetical protein
VGRRCLAGYGLWWGELAGRRAKNPIRGGMDYLEGRRSRKVEREKKSLDDTIVTYIILSTEVGKCSLSLCPSLIFFSQSIATIMRPVPLAEAIACLDRVGKGEVRTGREKELRGDRRKLPGKRETSEGSERTSTVCGWQHTQYGSTSGWSLRSGLCENNQLVT